MERQPEGRRRCVVARRQNCQQIGKNRDENARVLKTLARSLALGRRYFDYETKERDGFKFSICDSSK